MNKRKISFIFCFILTILAYNVFPYDSGKIDNPFDFLLGETEQEIKANNGLPQKENIYFTHFAGNSKYANKYVYLFYDYMRVHVWHSSSDRQFISVNIFSPRISILGGICVGMKVEEVLRKLGTPDSESHNRVFYSGDTHYISFDIDEFRQILSINWEYFLD